jgi:transcriptional/translational regulatory protein YebC/TACO1
VELDEGLFTVTTSFEDFGPMQKKLEELGIEAESAELQQVPKTTTEVDADTARKVMRLVEFLEEDDDVQAVFHNMELTEALAAQLD